ncbi:hypothetical protein ACTWP5_15310 [Streptomyces sp. 4N509B]|uniref:hypothetical protein n=1 Tax=Streptomyces sp. 4N509B TaxID=3457413 RepID=UPI003FD212EB
MLDSPRLRLLRRLRTHRSPSSLHEDHLPERPTASRLREVAAAVESGERGSAEELAAHLLAVDRDGDPAVLAEAERLLARASPRLWLALDVATRRAWWRAPRWSLATARRLLRGDPSPLGLVVASFHPDGFVRDVVVAHLAELDEPLALPALALRAADWVPRVRDRARAAFDERLDEPTAVVLLATAPVALALWERRQGRWLADRVEAVLREGPEEVLAAALAAPDWRTRRTAHLTALAVGRLDLTAMLRAAAHDGDLPTRLRCAEAAVRTAVAAGTVERVRPLLGSGTASVRAEAVHTLARHGDVAPAVAALADRNPVVREVARAVLRPTGLDPAAHYRRLAASPAPEPGALAGLGETGTADDAGLVRAFLDHPRPRGRAEAVRALRRLGAADPDTLAPMLTDASGAVVRQVTSALRPHASGLDRTRLRALLAPGGPPHVRTAAYRLLHARDTWTRLLTDLDLVADPSPAIRRRARTDLANWLTY